MPEKPLRIDPKTIQSINQLLTQKEYLPYRKHRRIVLTSIQQFRGSRTDKEDIKTFLRNEFRKLGPLEQSLNLRRTLFEIITPFTYGNWNVRAIGGTRAPRSKVDAFGTHGHLGH